MTVLINRKTLDDNSELAVAMDILLSIKRADYSAHIVGGAVRDLLLGVQPNDIDIATNCPMGVLDAKFHTYKIGQSTSFGIMGVSEKGHHFEVAQYRSDGYHSDNRHPDKVWFETDFAEDVLRRDFTMNAMGIDYTGTLFDTVGGKADVQAKLLRTVGVADERFAEDALRMLRAVRFSARFGFAIESDTKKAIKRNAKLIENVAHERWLKELISMASLSGDKFADAIQQMMDLGLLRLLLPYVYKLDFADHDPFSQWHPEGNAFMHTLAALRVLNSDDPVENLSVLFHDIGKSICGVVDRNGKIKYYGHEDVGANLFVNKIAPRLRMSNDMTKQIEFAIRYHMDFGIFPYMRSGKIWKIVSSPNWPLLARVAYADKMCRLDKSDLVKYNNCLNIGNNVLNTWQNRTSKTVKNVVSGHVVMQLTGLKPGPEVGRLLSKVTEWAMDNHVYDQKLIESFIVQEYTKRGTS